MKAFRTEVLIDASQERVWSVLTGFDKYPSWNPFIRQVRGHPCLWETLRLTVKLSKFPLVRFDADIDSMVFCRRIGWHAVFLKGFMEAHHWFELYENSGETLLVHSEEFTGVVSGPVLAILSRAFINGYGQMNLALKTESERC